MSKAQIFNAPAAPPLAQTLAGQTALITGASSGIGRAIAVELAARGASLCLLGRRPAVLQDIALRLAPDACKWVYRTDLVDSEEIEKLRGSLARDGAEPTVIVHSAGVIALGPLEQASLADFDRQLNVNVRAPYALTQALLGGLKARRGQIVFINSSAGVSAVPGSGQYSATKHALRALADSLRAEVNGQVRVTSVFTGATATPMQRSLHAAKGRAYAPETLIQAEDVAAVVVHVLSLPRTVELTDIHMRPAQPPA
jgi:NADP-dependent 3-hydroxy acid dehydrogenase YdfG